MATSEDGRCLECDGRGLSCICGRPVVLIIDDDPKLLLALKRGLEPYGWRVHCATDPIDAIIAYGVADVVLSDWEMPHGGGARVLEESPVPVVVQTGGDAPVRHLTKPVALHDLDAALREAKARKLPRELAAWQFIIAAIDIAIEGAESFTDEVLRDARRFRDDFEQEALRLAVDIARQVKP